MSKIYHTKNTLSSGDIVATELSNLDSNELADIKHETISKIGVCGATYSTPTATYRTEIVSQSPYLEANNGPKFKVQQMHLEYDGNDCDEYWKDV